VIRGEGGASGRLVVVLAFLVATAFAPVAGASTGAVSDAATTRTVDAPDAAVSGLATAQREPPGRNNSTVAHRNPDEVSDEGNLSDVQTWLAREMAGQLSRSVNASEEDRERARQLVGNDSEYARLAEQYGEVTEGSSGEATGRNRFSEVGLLQQEFFTNVQEYRETYRTYEEVRSGNATSENEPSRNATLRTRRLAHELERRADSVNRTAVRLNRSYRNLSSARQDGQNFTRTIGRIRGNVTETQISVRNRTLVRTELSVRTEQSAASFADPATLVGRLRTANGTPVADRNVTLKIDNRTLRTATDEDGRFRVEYRPILASAGERERSVSFRPGNESLYAGADASVRFSVERVAPTVTVSTSSGTVRYGEALAVEGRVAADGVGAPDVPLVLTVGGVPVERLRTEANGSFEAAPRLPANVSAGSRQVRVRLALDNVTRNDGPIALAPANATAPVAVESTPTSLSITEARTLDDSVSVTGRLLAADERPVPNRTVSVVVGETTVGTATTNANGEFATAVELPESVRAGAEVSVIVRYFEGGNLESSRTDATVSLPDSDSALSDDTVPLGMAGLLFLTVFGVAVWRLRADDAETLAAERADDAEEIAGVARRSPEELLDSATASLDAGAFDAAVVTAYAAVRSRFDETLESRHPRTHLEFYAACRDADLPDDRLETLAQLTERYERAAFASESVSETEAEEALRLAESLPNRLEELDPAA